MANEWLSFRLDVMGALIVFGAAVLAIINRGKISASLAALTLSEALDVTMFLKAAVTSGAMFETRFNSVERLASYWDLPQEAPALIKDNRFALRGVSVLRYIGICGHISSCEEGGGGTLANKWLCLRKFACANLQTAEV